MNTGLDLSRTVGIGFATESKKFSGCVILESSIVVPSKSIALSIGGSLSSFLHAVNKQMDRDR
jgi:hypothetical protein